MALQSERSLDHTDWNILRELQRDARLSYHELGQRVGLSAPAAASRVRKLEDAVVNIVTSSALTSRMIDWEQLAVDVDPPTDPGWTRQ